MDYASEKEDFSYEDICLRFGGPESYAKEYISAADKKSIKSYSSPLKPIVITVITVLALALAVYIAAITIAFIDGTVNGGGHYEVCINGEKLL